MCILFIAINQHPDYPLIVAANRDEYFDRPSQSMHYWSDSPNILAGRDLLKGGSWLGVNMEGRFCAVTNFRTRSGIQVNAKSRGKLVQRYLNNSTDDEDFISYLRTNSGEYNPFNLAFGNFHQIKIFSSPDASLHPLSKGFHSLSNGFVDQHWPKMSQGVNQLSHIIGRASPLKISELNTIMRNRTQADYDDLPDTGVDQEVEKHLSSIFISGSDYGTRTTTYVLYTKTDMTIHEINYSSVGQVSDEQIFSQRLVAN